MSKHYYHSRLNNILITSCYSLPKNIKLPPNCFKQVRRRCPQSGEKRGSFLVVETLYERLRVGILGDIEIVRIIGDYYLCGLA